MTDLSPASIQEFSRCDYAVVASYLDFFGLPFTHRSLHDYLDHTGRHSCMTEIADCLAQHGLEITLVNSGQDLFSRPAWQSFLSNGKLSQAEQVTSNMLEPERVMRKGVHIRRSLISQEVLDELLKDGQPVIIGYDPALLHPVEESMFQQAIVAKKSEDQYQLYEPLRIQTTTSFPKSILVAAILATKHHDPSFQSLISGKERLEVDDNANTEEPPHL